jgi:hypothetical protein
MKHLTLGSSYENMLFAWGSHTSHWVLTKENKAMVEDEQQEKSKEYLRKSAPVPLYPPRISHETTLD